MNSKKYYLLICTSLYAISFFFYFWFINNIEEKIPFFSVMIMLVLYLLYIIILIKSLINIIKDKRYIDIITIILLFLCTFLQFNFPFEESKINVEWNKYEKARYEVIELAKKDKLRFIGDTKTAVLPNNLKKVSQTGEIVVYLNEDKKQVIGFFINRGMLSGSKMLIYSNCGKKLINEKEKNAVNIKKIKEKWYYVETE